MPIWGDWNIVDLTVAGSSFVLALTMWLIGLLLWHVWKAKNAENLQRRLGAGRKAPAERELRLWRDGEEAITTVPGGRSGRSLAHRLGRLGQDAGWDVSGPALISGVAGACLAAFGVSFLLGHSVLLGVGVAVALVMAFNAYLEHCIAKRTALFESQLIDGLELAARSLQAGHPLQASFRLISEEIADPVGTLFARICQQQNLGLSLEDSLREVAEDSPGDDLKLFATSVIIQLQSGGNLADTMIRLATVMRDRIDLARHVRVLTAQTQFAKKILMAMPFALFIIINVVNPSYMEPLYTTFVGEVLLAIGGVLMVLGAFLMKKLSQVRY